ncbi:MAG TPA: hypothetical protein VD758_12835 [Gemmatimonadaceae bacterium]|nr:hypothetical protein [Gemmatimonadaceae bacterium]
MVIAVAGCLLLACGSDPNESFAQHAASSTELQAPVRSWLCKHVKGIQWCKDDTFTASETSGCAALCTSLGKTVMSDTAKWFAAQSTDAKCQAIGKAFGFSNSVVQDSTAGCIEYSGNDMTCSNSSDCPAYLTNGTPDLGYSIICPCK